MSPRWIGPRSAATGNCTRMLEAVTTTTIAATAAAKRANISHLSVRTDRHQTGAPRSKANRAALVDRAVEKSGRKSSGGESGPDFLLQRQGVRRKLVVTGLDQER